MPKHVSDELNEAVALRASILQSLEDDGMDLAALRIAASALAPDRVHAPWQHIDSGTLADAERLVVSHLAHKAAFFPKDASTLANITLHCIREVKATRQRLQPLSEEAIAEIAQFNHDPEDFVREVETRHGIAQPQEANHG